MALNPSITTILFDLDGTLTDPKPGIVGSIRHALERMGREIPEHGLDWCIGPPLRDSFGEILQESDPDILEEAVRLYRERYAAGGKFENSVYVGIVDLLAGLRRNNLRLFVATSKPTVFALEILEHFNLIEYFEEVQGSELDGRLSDKAEIIETLIVREGIDAERAMMIGDRSHDMIGAKRNAVLGGGVTYGYGSAEELRSAGADHLFDHPSEILRLVVTH